MAVGDTTIYADWLKAQVDATLSSTPVDFDTDVLKVGILTSAFTSDTTAGSAQNFWADISANEVSTGTSYTGPITLTSVTVTGTTTVATFDAADINLLADIGGGFTNGRWAVLYKDSGVEATSPLIMVLDLGSDKNLQAANIDLIWAVTGLITWSKV